MIAGRFTAPVIASVFLITFSEGESLEQTWVHYTELLDPCIMGAKKKLFTSVTWEEYIVSYLCYPTTKKKNLTIVSMLENKNFFFFLSSVKLHTW